MSKIYYTKTFGHQLLLMSLGSLKNPGIRAQPGFSHIRSSFSQIQQGQALFLL
ncbi:hypothetical protein MUS_1002 [Bacillus velezensis YAU B9601-Y2]|uniref:Uncharacterized protein n=1 Tax=Bacillus amyloliquefaciens (strain Y2) TaxID=1155777 RepID=I2C316_BACAY|nr:hypothetical protein MUS_1002 [Bacillus velezensis YAU B9601-Y2]RUS06213.1 hypothetical protein EFW58_02253 [Bacillus velezensis]